MAQHDDPGTVATPMSPACALAVTAALTDLRTWYSNAYPGEHTSFESYLQQRYGFVACDVIEGHRITVAFRPSAGRGEGVWYAIDRSSFEVIERVFGR
jgi:hypothetical protein